MKVLKNNHGVTLLELVVAMAILALLGVAIVSIMASNTSVFRKNKADISVQTSAEETYNVIEEDLMQAKYVYIEGYYAENTIPFTSMKIGNDYSGDATDTFNLKPIKILKSNDQIIMDLSPGSCDSETFIAQFCASTVTDRDAVADNYRDALATNADKEKFDKVYASLKYMDSIEASRYGRFLDYVEDNGESTATSYTPFNDAKLKSTSSISGVTTNTYNNVYVTKLILEYNVPLDESYVSNTNNIQKYEYKYKYDNAGTEVEVTKEIKNEDYCICEYNFKKNVISYTKQYKAMDKLNTTGSGDAIVFSKLLNWADTKNYSGVSGVVANIDGNNESVQLEMFFNDKNRTYKSNGMTYLRNSYVLHDAK